MKARGLVLASLLCVAIPFAALADPHGRGRDFGDFPHGRGHDFGDVPHGRGRDFGDFPHGRVEAGPPGHSMGLPPGWRGVGPPGQRGGPGPRGERVDRWDAQRFNGYWLGNRWHYGPPPGEVEVAPTFRPGYAPWRRGAFLPPYYQDQVVDEYWRFHLRRPPLGYHWIEVGGAFLLVSDSTGLIFDIIPGE